MSQYGDLEVSEERQLKKQDHKNRRPKHMELLSQTVLCSRTRALI